MTLYIYEIETNEVVETVTGDTNEECEKFFEKYDSDAYGCTYSPAFGFASGLN